MDIEQLLQTFRHDPNVTAWRTREARPACYAPTPPWLDGRLQAALAGLGIARLYSHQVQALEAADRGEHVVVATGTASGKSLCYHLPALQAVLSDPQASALYLFPTKALAHDQESFLQRLIEALPDPERTATTSRPRFATYDGDTPPAARPRIRREARLVLTNPDMLHAGILPRHPHWERFFRGLRYVILDELHAYRGLFGSHVANVLRRLRRICSFYGSRPQFLCASATIANPGELAGRLVEAPVTVVDDDGAPRGRTHLLLYNPPLVDPALGLRRSLLLEAQRLAEQFLAAQMPTVVFARTRLGMELLLTYLRQTAGRPGRLRGYRGGYLPAVRREIEAGLRTGQVLGVVATNALELGVDIGTLAACVMAGYPGTIASTWQQAGRAGRREAPAAAVLVAGPGPLDQYLATHPDYFFGRSPEHARINPDNPLLLADHLRCAAFELAFAGEDFGTAPAGALLDYLAEEGSLLAEGGHHFWIGPGWPAGRVSLRTASADPIVIVEGAGERPRTLGQVDRPSAPTLVYPGAVYLHEGRFYQVEELDWEEGLARVRPAEVDHYTQASLSVDWEVVREDGSATQGQGSRHHGEVQVRAQATAYRRVRLYTHETLGWGTIDLPAQEFLTQAWWLKLPWLAQELLRPDYGPNWAEQRRRARQRDRYTCQRCGTQEARTGREHDVHHLVPFRHFGYVPGENEAYLQANDLANLTTLCRVCHSRVDHGPREATVAALQGAGHILRYVAPLFLMCDPGDIQVSTRLRMPPEGLPVVLIYDDCAGGAGLSPHLFDRTAELLPAAVERIRECPCQNGCPSCVGPIEEGAGQVKQQVAGALGLLLPEG
jgi:DEAD/DEAH box helicase domain-containing protein